VFQFFLNYFEPIGCYLKSLFCLRGLLNSFAVSTVQRNTKAKKYAKDPYFFDGLGLVTPWFYLI
jgi:hypothetical protein